MDDFDVDFDGGDSFDVSDVSSDIADVSDDIGDITDVEMDLPGDVTADMDALEPFEEIETLDDGGIADIADETEPDMDDFEQRIEEMSLDELNAEREKLVELGALDGEQLAQQYDDFMAAQAAQEQFDELTDGVSIEQLEEMKSRLESGDQDMLDAWGLNDDASEDDGDQKVLRR